MPEYTPGERYPITAQMAAGVMRAGWPVVYGDVDLTRGRRFLKPPCTWEFWTTDGRKIEFDHGPGGLIVSQTPSPDPDRPDPL